MAKLSRSYLSIGWTERMAQYVQVIEFSLGADNLNEHMLEEFGFDSEQFTRHMKCYEHKDQGLFLDLFRANVLVVRQTIEAKSPHSAMLSISGALQKGQKKTKVVGPRMFLDGDVIAEPRDGGGYDIYVKQGILAIKVWEGVALES